MVGSSLKLLTVWSICPAASQGRKKDVRVSGVFVESVLSATVWRLMWRTTFLFLERVTRPYMQLQPFCSFAQTGCFVFDKGQDKQQEAPRFTRPTGHQITMLSRVEGRAAIIAAASQVAISMGAYTDRTRTLPSR